MMARSHALSGAAVFVAAAPLLDHVTRIGPLELAAGAVVTAGAAMLPDFDHPSSTIARTFGWPTQLLAQLVAAKAGGHRRGTHSLLFCVLAGIVAGVLMLLGPAGQTVAVVLPLGLGARALGWTRTRPADNLVTFLVCAGLAIGFAAAVNLAWLPAAWALGCLAHLLGDACTNSGVPFLWPSRRMYGVVLPLRLQGRWHLVPLRIRTGGAGELLVVPPVLIMSMVGMIMIGWLPA